jgi:hypothetical protein
MFSSLIPEDIPEAPPFDCLFERFLSNSTSELLENNDSMSVLESAPDVSTVAVDKRALVL